jgi:hypothetical protein
VLSDGLHHPLLPLVAWYAASSVVDVADLSVVPVSE